MKYSIEDFEPIRMSIQGEVIRDLETNYFGTNRKKDHSNSDDEDQQKNNSINNGGFKNNIYIERQKKRAKM